MTDAEVANILTGSAEAGGRPVANMAFDCAKMGISQSQFRTAVASAKLCVKLQEGVPYYAKDFRHCLSAERPIGNWSTVAGMDLIAATIFHAYRQATPAATAPAPSPRAPAAPPAPAYSAKELADRRFQILGTPSAIGRKALAESLVETPGVSIDQARSILSTSPRTGMSGPIESAADVYARRASGNAGRGA